MVPDIDALLQAFVDDELAEHPELASELGADGHDDRLTDQTASGIARRHRLDRKWLERFEAVLGGDGLTVAEQVDAELVVSTLRGRAVSEDFEDWRRNPDHYVQPPLEGVFALFLHRLRPDRELAAAAAARLRAVPGMLDAGRANLDPALASPLLVARAGQQCAAAARYTREFVPLEVAEDDGRHALADAGEVAAAAYESFAGFLDDLAARAHGTYAIGEKRYTALLQERELLEGDAGALRTRGEAVWEALRDEMRECTRAIDGGHDWHAAVEALNADHPADAGGMRLAYADWTARARRFLVEHDLVSFPDGERCDVDPSPVFQRPVIAVAFYHMPPPFRPSLAGHFFVPYPADGTTPDDVVKRLASNNHASIPTISVHEAYPGHHWHLVVARASGRPVRHVLRSSYFAEGWALYAEKMMREAGFFGEPRQVLGHLNARLFRAARIVVDTSLHCGDMTPDEATAFMVERACLPEPTARAEVTRYCAWPTQASSYLTGSLEIERIREEWLARRARPLKEFHDAIAGLGCMPVALHERSLAAQDANSG